VHHVGHSPRIITCVFVWDVTVREEHRMGVRVGRMLRSILVSKKQKVTEGWKKWHSENLRNVLHIEYY